MSAATSEMERALGTRPVATSVGREWSSVVAQRWQHDELHARTEKMAQHVVMTYFGAPHRIEARFANAPLRSSTRTGAITLIPADHDAHWDIFGPLDVIHVYLSSDRMSELAQQAGLSSSELMPRVGHDDAVASQLLGLLGRELDAPHQRDRLFVEQLSDLLCLHLLREHSIGAMPISPLAGGLSPTQLKRVIEFMDAKLADPIGLQDLASVVGLSRSHFCTAFKVSTGMQPYSWLIAHRIPRQTPSGHIGVAGSRGFSCSRIRRSGVFRTTVSQACR